MRRRAGSALLMVLLIIAGLSALLMRVHYRSSLLLETVREREKQIQWYYAAQTFMLYAIHLAKKNWRYIHEQSSSHELIYNDMPWQITEQIKGQGKMTFSSQETQLHIKVHLYDNGQLRQHLACTIRASQGNHLSKQIEGAIIHDWSESEGDVY